MEPRFAIHHVGSKKRPVRKEKKGGRKKRKESQLPTETGGNNEIRWGPIKRSSKNEKVGGGTEGPRLIARAKKHSRKPVGTMNDARVKKKTTKGPEGAKCRLRDTPKLMLKKRNRRVNDRRKKIRKTNQGEKPTSLRRKQLITGNAQGVFPEIKGSRG